MDFLTDDGVNIDDPLSFDFFGFDFDFKEYDSDEIDKESAASSSTPQQPTDEDNAEYPISADDKSEW
eukprot:gene3091-2264_t